MKCVRGRLTRTAAAAALLRRTAAPACCGGDVLARLQLLRRTLAAAVDDDVGCGSGVHNARRRALLALLKRCVRGGELTCQATDWAPMARMLMSPMAEVRGGADGGAGADAGLAAAGATAAADGDADAAAYLRYAQRLGRWLRARRALLAAVWPMPDDADEPLC